MPTLMTQTTFDKLLDVSHQLAPRMIAGGLGLSNIFVPWAGERLISDSRGIYYVGIDPNPKKDEYGAEQTFDVRQKNTEKYCDECPDRSNLFWQFFGALTHKILGKHFYEAQEHWGWSNLLKLVSLNASCRRPRELIDGQRAACVEAFREEIATLRNSLIVIASGEEYGILYPSIADATRWKRESTHSKIYWFCDPNSENLYVHCYHPQHMNRRQGMFDAAVTDIVTLTQQKIPSFE